MISADSRDNNNETFEQYHRRHFMSMVGFPGYANTNIDKVCRYLDEPTFQSFLDLQEQDKAYSIDYAHGLELDDEFGDPYGINRNGLNDTEYRFLLKCHMLAIKCNGSLPELIQFISSVLNCNADDVTLGMARHYVNNQLVGEPDTILIKGININNVSNSHLVPLLADQLQYAVAADKRVDDVNFFTNIAPANIGISTNLITSASMQINIPEAISNEVRFNISNNIHTDIVSGGKIQVNIPQYDNTIHMNNKRGINIIIGESSNI